MTGTTGITGTRESCTCERCRGACEHKPGWFLPGEAEKAAAFLGMGLEEFFARHLMVDYWAGEDPVFLLSPAVAGGEPGKEFPVDPNGTCVFYNGGLCSIHAAKPFECRDSFHDDGPETGGRHRGIADAWKGHQAQVKDLLGKEPEMPDPLAFLEWGVKELARTLEKPSPQPPDEPT